MAKKKSVDKPKLTNDQIDEINDFINTHNTKQEMAYMCVVITLQLNFQDLMKKDDKNA
jgi:hypothetical protein